MVDRSAYATRKVNLSLRELCAIVCGQYVAASRQIRARSASGDVRCWHRTRIVVVVVVNARSHCRGEKKARLVDARVRNSGQYRSVLLLTSLHLLTSCELNLQSDWKNNHNANDLNVDLLPTELSHIDIVGTSVLVA